ncbi:MAG: amino acid ABC transporter permease [Candidatus Bipolaricaulota bacterium]
MLHDLAEYVPLLLRMSLVNVALLFSLLCVGFALGTLVAVVQVYGRRLASAAAAGYAWVFRSIPSLVLLFLVYYGPPRLGLRISPFLAATLALGLCSSGYQSQIFRGALLAISGGQMQAARSLGMSRGRAIRTILLPQAFRLAIPGWSNEFSSVVKDTTLAYVVGLNEVMRATRIINDTRYDLTMPALLLTAALFLLMTNAGNLGLGAVERRFGIPGLQMPGRGRATDLGR